MRILIVEDERALCDTLAKSLKRKGYEADACYDGDSALEWLLAEKYDLILLDLNLPGRDGMELLRALRERDRETRVLILSARSRISDKVEGLDCGANDYLVKPFHLEELEARVRSLTRRSFVQHDALLRCGELSFDTVKRTAQAKGENCGADPQGKRHSGIPAAQPGAAGEPGGADGARVGRQRGQLQQFHPGAYLLPAQKAEGGAGLRSDSEPHRRGISDGRP